MRVEPIKVLVAEDSVVVRTGIKKVLDSHPDIQVVAECADGQSAIEAARRLKPEVLLVDLGLPDMSGIDVLKQVRGISSAVRIMIVTAHDAQTDIYQAFEAGADGYFVKSRNMDQLPLAVRSIAEGAGWLDPAISTRVLQSCASGAAKLISELKDAERTKGPKLADSDLPKTETRITTVSERHSPVHILLLLGAAFETKEDFIQAEACFLGAVAIAEQHQSKTVELAEIYTKVADFYYGSEKYVQAEKHYQKALTIRHAVLGEKHTDVAASLENLANLYDTQSVYEEAERYYLWSLRIRENLGSADLTAETCSKLAWICRAQGKPDLAEAMEQRARSLRNAKSSEAI